MTLSEKLTITEVAPRDGFQNTSTFIPTNDKIRIIERLLQAGIDSIQIGSFVNPKAIPQMRDTADVVASILPRFRAKNLSVLVPNERGARFAVESGIPEITFVISVTESHNRANVRRSVDDAFAELATIVSSDSYPFDHIKLDLATVFGCPFDGITPFELVRARVARAHEIGIRDICLCDTIGTATPRQTRAYISALRSEFPDIAYRVHFHDTRGVGIANTLAAINSGITRVETSVCGIGGCPFAPGAAGNTSTEDLVFLLSAMEIDTGISLEEIIAAAKFVATVVPGPNTSGHLIHVDDDKMFPRGLYKIVK